MELTTDRRAAALRGSSPAAVIPIGKPSEAPSPHTTAPAYAPAATGEKTTVVDPRITSTAVPRRVATRPKRVVSEPPTSRPTVIAVTKTAKPTDPAACETS